MAKAKPLTVTDLKIIRGQVYATLTMASADSAATTLHVKLTAKHKGLSEALAPLHELVQEAADQQLKEAVVNQAASTARANARADVATQVLGMIKRGTMPHELERALQPIARSKN